MLFDQDKDKGEKETKKRSIWGTLFNPDIGNDIRPIGESTRMFVQMIAMILASNKLFPKDHPALRDPNARLTLGQVFSISLARLSWRKECLPQIILFAAVWGCLIFSALFVLTFVLSLFVGSAHAQTVTTTNDSMFVPAVPANDMALNWIDYIFLGKDYTVTLPDGSGVPKGGAWQKALGAALSFYSTGILVFAGVILLYHLMSMIAETAHTGKVMGNANQIWAPIRLVVAIGLLIPIGAGTTSGDSVSGFNTGQYIVIQMTKWGSGLASNAWQIFVDTITPGKASSCSEGSPSCLRASKNAETLAVKMIRNYLCVATYNYYLNGNSWENKESYHIVAPTDAGEGNHLFGPVDTSFLGWTSVPEERLCGGYYIPTPPSTSSYKAVYAAQNNTFSSRLSFFKETAQTLAKHYVGETKSSPNPNSLVNQAAEKYRSDLDSTIQSVLPQADQAAAEKKENTVAEGFVKTAGWLTAGAWFNKIAKNQEDRTLSVTTGLPSALEGPLVSEKSLSSDPKSEKEWGKAVGGGVASAAMRTAEVMQKFSNEMSLFGGAKEITFAKALTNEAGKLGILDILKGASSPSQALMEWIQLLLVSYNVTTESGRMAVKFNSELNPIQEVAQYGQNMVGVSLGLFTAAVAAFIAGSFPTLAGIGTFGILLAGLAVPFFTAGAMLGFMLPLVPFLRFFFGALSWIIGVFEAVVAMPLLALAHLNPEGAGLPGGMARGGYFLILNMFLRPVLMVFGLIAGYLLFIVSLSLLNAIFFLAFDGAGAISDSNAIFSVVSYIVMSFIYAGVVYTLGNNCFKSIGLFPQHALKWLGQGSGHIETMGNPQTTQQAMAAVGSYVLGKMVGDSSRSIADFTKERKGIAKQKKDQKDASALDKQRHEEMLSALGGRGGSSGPEVSGPAGGGGKQIGSDRSTAKQMGAEIAADPNYKTEEGSLIAENKAAQARQDRTDDAGLDEETSDLGMNRGRYNYDSAGLLSETTSEEAKARKAQADADKEREIKNKQADQAARDFKSKTDPYFS